MCKKEQIASAELEIGGFTTVWSASVVSVGEQSLQSPVVWRTSMLFVCLLNLGCKPPLRMI